MSVVIKIEGPTKEWVLNNKEWIEGTDRQEVYNRYINEVEDGLTPQSLTIRIRQLLGLKPTYKSTRYPYLPDNLELEVPGGDWLDGEEVGQVHEFIKELNPGEEFSQHELNAYLYRTRGLNYKQYKHKGKSVYRYVFSVKEGA